MPKQGELAAGAQPAAKDEPTKTVVKMGATETTEPSQPQANNQPVGTKAATVVRRGLSLNLSLRLDGDDKDENNE